MKKLIPLLAICLSMNVFAGENSEMFQALYKKEWEFRVNEFPYLAGENGSKEKPT